MVDNIVLVMWGIVMQLLIDSLSKKYKTKYALNKFQCELKEGVYGLLGPNGAGKSTLMKLLVQNISPSEGEISFDGKNILDIKSEYKGMIGYMPQQQEIFPFFTGRKFLNYMGILKGIDKKVLSDEIEYMADKVNLIEELDNKIGSYSGGMKQRLLIAQAFLGNPRIVIFDEPTAGLDPKERIHARNLIAENSKDKIILIATHVVQDIEFIADEIILLKNGNLIEKSSPAKLLDKLRGQVWEFYVDTEKAGEYIKNNMVSSAIRHGDKTLLRVVAHEIVAENPVNVEPTLEDVYLSVFGGM